MARIGLHPQGWDRWTTWPDQSYLPDNVDGRLLDPDDDTGRDICSGYDDDRVEDRSGVIE
jgi:hypothetical protein